MFGYIAPNLSILNDSQRARYRSVYCGLCRTLRVRHGLTGSMTLSNDLTFLALLLNSLYESTEEKGRERCIVHPLRQHEFVTSEPFKYVADINVALAYHKCMDNWIDDHSVLSRGEAILLQRAYDSVSQRYPDKCTAIEHWIEEIHDIERSHCAGIDAPVNSTGRILGMLFCWKEDFWADSLRKIGDGLGRFIYMMDAYDDLSKDIHHHSFNPLIPEHDRDDFEQMCKDALLMMVADSTMEFEQLPIVQDADLLRNILYSGIWSRYGQLQKRKEANKKGAK